MRKRWKRKSGYVTAKLTISKKDLIKENLFVNARYDDWNDYRDSFRDRFRDFKLIKKIHKGHKNSFEELLEKRELMNKKQKMLLKRRKRKNLNRISV